MTKRKKTSPSDNLSPRKDSPIPIFGFMSGTLEIRGDIILPIKEVWNADEQASSLEHFFQS